MRKEHYDEPKCILGLTSSPYNTGIKQFELDMMKNFIEWLVYKSSEYKMKI